MTVPPRRTPVSLTAAESAPSASRVDTSGPLLSKLPRPYTIGSRLSFLSSQTRAMRSRIGASYRALPTSTATRAAPRYSTVPPSPENGRPSYHSCGSPSGTVSVCASSTTARLPGPVRTSMTFSLPGWTTCASTSVPCALAAANTRPATVAGSSALPSHPE